MNDIFVRALSGLVFVILVLGGIWYSNLSAIFVFSLFFFLGLLEYIKLFKNHPTVELCKTSFFIPSLVGFALLSSISLGVVNHVFYVLIFPLFFLFLLPELWRKKENPILNLAVLVFGWLYLLIPFYLFVELSILSSYDSPILIGMFILIWSNDSFAYLSGRFFGKTKLFERISPKKTWEGTIGGLILTFAASILISNYLDHENDMFFWGVASLMISLASILGDLLESLFKRSLNIKDSGSIMPGHGGILDRFDAALMSVVFFYAWHVIYPYL
jgi:phosphatidate cytidylyltransferase